MSLDFIQASSLSFDAVREFRHLLWSLEQSLEVSLMSPSCTPEVLSELQDLARDIQNILNKAEVMKVSNSMHQELSLGDTARTKTRRMDVRGSDQWNNTNIEEIRVTPAKQRPKESDKRYPSFEREPREAGSKEEQEYGNMAYNIQELQRERGKLMNRLSESERKADSLLKEKSYCIDLLNRNVTKDSDVEIENKMMKKQLEHLQQQTHQLEGEKEALFRSSEQKSLLLRDIEEFLKENSSASRSYTRSCQIVEENSRLIKQLVEYQHENVRINKEWQWLHELQLSNEAEIQSLVGKNEDLLGMVESLEEENEAFRLKNQELINIEEGKKLNDIVHRENKHLLQINFELGNKIYLFEREQEKLLTRIIELERLSQSILEGPYEEYALSTNPSARRNVLNDDLYDKPSKSANDAEETAQQDTIHTLNVRLKNQSDLNSELQGKIQELLGQLYICEKSIFQKEKEIANLNSTLSPLNRSSVTVQSPSRQEIEMTEKQQHKPTGAEEVFTLEQFLSKFEPSLMDTLFIMLRMAEIAVVMLQEGCPKTMLPEELLLQLDDPNKPQNIIVQLETNDHNSKLSHQLYAAPEVVEGEIINEQAVIWNIGMVFYYLINKEQYFKSMRDLDQTGDIVLQDSLMPEVEQLISACLTRSPRSRISLDEMLEGISQQINRIFS